MRICIFGAGAIGGYLAVELALAGVDVSVVARGAHLAAIRRNGLVLRIGGIEKRAVIPASDNAAEFGQQDFVICTLKAHQAAEAVDQMLPLLGASTAMVVAMNGLPWWYFYRYGGPLEGHHLAAVDPGGRQWAKIGPERAIGCVVEPACEIVAPGVIEHHMFNRFILGEPDDSLSPRMTALSEMFVGAGFDAPMRKGIRWNVWLKLLGNVCFNPISLLTGAPIGTVVANAGLRELCRAMMAEARNVAGAIGVAIPEEMIERRLNSVAGLDHKMSMLQDLERNKSLEIDALVTSVHEVGRLVGVATPNIDIVLGLAAERGRQAGLYAGNA